MCSKNINKYQNYDANKHHNITIISSNRTLFSKNPDGATSTAHIFFFIINLNIRHVDVKY